MKLPPRPPAAGGRRGGEPQLLWWFWSGLAHTVIPTQSRGHFGLIRVWAIGDACPQSAAAGTGFVHARTHSAIHPSPQPQPSTPPPPLPLAAERSPHSAAAAPPQLRSTVVKIHPDAYSSALFLGMYLACYFSPNRAKIALSPRPFTSGFVWCVVLY